MLSRRIIVAASLLLTAFSVSAEEPMTVQLKRMSMDTALSIAKATVDACREEGIQIGVTVVDRDGIPQAVLRDTIAPTITVPISRKKAYAAVMFGVASSQLVDRHSTALSKVEGTLFSAGAVPIEVGGVLLGAVGVSGAPSGETDEACAARGFAAVKEDLEMAD